MPFCAHIALAPAALFGLSVIVADPLAAGNLKSDRAIAPGVSSAPQVSQALGASDPRALELLSQIIKAQQALDSFTATVASTSFAPGIDKSASDHNKIADVAYQKPNRFLAKVRFTDGATITVLADGHNLSRQDSRTPDVYFQEKQFEFGERNRMVSPNQGEVSPIGALEECLNGDARHPLSLVGVIMGRDTVSAKNAKELERIAEAYAVKLGPPAEQDGVTVDVVEIELRNKFDISFEGQIAAGKDDHLIRSVRYDCVDTSDSWGRQRKGDRHMSELYTHVKANPVLPPGTFDFVAISGSRQVEDPRRHR